MAEELRAFELDVTINTNKQTYRASWESVDLDLADLPGALREWLHAGGWVDATEPARLRVFDGGGATFDLEGPSMFQSLYLERPETATPFVIDQQREGDYCRGFDDGVEHARQVSSWRHRAAIAAGRVTGWLR